MFSHLIGNEEVKTRLSRMLANGRLPNAMLFSGPDGVGKKLFAVEIARSFVCPSPIENRACGECSACKRVIEFNTPTSDKGDDYDHVFFSDHADVGLTIPFKRNLRVGAIRALEIQANFRPYEARARFFIVDDADKMNDAAANALLKTLEEPAETTYIILVSSRPNLLLSTIRSRCQTIRFAPISPLAIETYLRTERSMSAEDAGLVARVSNGSVTKAASVDLEQYRMRRESFLKILQQSLITADRSFLVRASEQLNDAKNKDRFEENLEILEALIRDLWLLKSKGDLSQIRNFDIGDKLMVIAAATTREKLASYLGEIELLRQSLAVNINRKITTDGLFMKMSA